jgi:hypothetical protein
MDGGHRNTTRKFAAHTTADLEKYVADSVFFTNRDEKRIQEVRDEIARRKAGTSVPFVVPQIR